MISSTTVPTSSGSVENLEKVIKSFQLRDLVRETVKTEKVKETNT